MSVMPHELLGGLSGVVGGGLGIVVPGAVVLDAVVTGADEVVLGGM